MRFSRLISLLVFGALLLTTACATTSSSGHRGGAPDFTLSSVDGRPVSLSKYLGKKVVLLNFWATWCAPCASELPHLQELYDTYKDQDLVILSIAMDGPETMANVAPFVRRQGLTFPVLLDPETRAVLLYNPSRSAPFNVIIGRDGKIAMAREGFASGDEKFLESTLLAAMKSETLPQAPVVAPENRAPCHTVEPAAAPAAKAE